MTDADSKLDLRVSLKLSRQTVSQLKNVWQATNVDGHSRSAWVREAICDLDRMDLDISEIADYVLISYSPPKGVLRSFLLDEQTSKMLKKMEEKIREESGVTYSLSSKIVRTAINRRLSEEIIRLGDSIGDKLQKPRETRSLEELLRQSGKLDESLIDDLVAGGKLAGLEEGRGDLSFLLEILQSASLKLVVKQGRKHYPISGW